MLLFADVRAKFIPQKNCKNMQSVFVLLDCRMGSVFEIKQSEKEQRSTSKSEREGQVLCVHKSEREGGVEPTL